MVMVILRERMGLSSGAARSRSLEPGTSEHKVVARELEIPSQTVAGFMTKLGGFAAVVTTVTTFLTFWLTDRSRRRDQARSVHLEVLQRALQVENDSQRLASAHLLLLRMGLLKDEKGSLDTSTRSNLYPAGKRPLCPEPNE
jgi:hypothetical protein